MLNRDAGQDGFTLIELLVVMVIGFIVLGAAAATTLTLTRASSFSLDETYTQDLNRLGLERLTRSVRQATYPEGKGPRDSSIFIKAHADDVIFHAKLDHAAGAKVERIRFVLVGDELQQTRMACKTAACTAYVPTPQGDTNLVIDSVRNQDLAGGACPDFAANEPVFRYFERSTDGSLTPMATPVPPPQYARIASVEVSLVVDVTTGGRAGCQRLSSLIHLRNWRG